MKNVIKRVFGSPESKTLKRLEKRVDEINQLEPKYKAMSDKVLAAQTELLKDRLKKKETLDDILPDAFALVRETARRVLGQRHFDVQIIGGMALHEGNVAEMRTGEGKTLVATLPVYLNALEGKGVHVVTVNDYLAQRDAGWMGEIYHTLGIRAAVIIADESYIFDPEYNNEEHEDERLRHLRPVSRREAYEADVTYGTNNEFGFDYLRDNMVREASQLRQRELHYAIVDEVDSILIDEARTPLIISAPASDSASSYALFAQVVDRLKPEHYEVDEKRKAVALNDEGVARVQEILGIDNLYGNENVQVIYHLEQALRAKALFKKDHDYVVTPDGEVIIVDEFTGRLMHGRRYNEGLHQAIEAKEGVEVLQESMTLATISFQNYFRLYKKLAGMTGTAATEAEEFQQIYDLNVIEIPTNKPNQRLDKPDRVYRSEKGKFQALVEDVKKLHEKGQPVLIGTVSIDKNEQLSRMLSKAGVPHAVLNAKNNESEASIVAKAGNKGAVTLATNIAGRGTDIVLGEGVVELGGLFVIGSERHEARRIDNQLRGRTGRQGDPGVTQFYVSAEDDLMRIFGGERIAALMDRLGVDETTPIENRSVSKALENAQKKVESQHFDIRKNVVQYDDVMNRHRKAIYSQRQNILKKDDISDDIKTIIKEEIELLFNSLTEKPDELISELKSLVPLDDKVLNKISKAESTKQLELAISEVMKLYDAREREFTPQIMRYLEREIYLQSLDLNWMQHLEEMDHLREGITWRSIGQRDPLVEYRREGQILFETLERTIRREIVRNIYRILPPTNETPQAPVETELTKAAAKAVESGAAEGGGKISHKSKSRQKDEDSAQRRPVTTSARAESKRGSGKSQLRKKRKQQRKNRKKRR